MCMEIILTLADNSTFSPHLSHFFYLFLFLWLVPQQEPGLAGAVLGHSREQGKTLPV